MPLLTQLAEALHFLHRRGVAHGDVKPANVLIVRDAMGRRAKLRGFGLARVAAEEGEDAVLDTRGTLPYMAGEVLQEPPLPATEDTLAAVDVCALGRVINEAATGVEPWSGYPDDAKRLHIKNGEMPHPFVGDSTLSPDALKLELESLVARCCSIFEARPIAAEVVNLLEELLPLLPAACPAPVLHDVHDGKEAAGAYVVEAVASPEKQAMVQAMADFLRELCGNLTPARAREAAASAPAHAVVSASRLQRQWEEAVIADGEATGLELVAAQLGLGQHDAREVAEGLSRRAKEEAKLEALAEFLHGLCEHPSQSEARAAAQAAAGQGIRSAERLQARWSEGGEAAGAVMLGAQLGLGEHDARDVGRALARLAEEEAKLRTMAEFLRGLCQNLSEDEAAAAAEEAASHGVKSVERLQLVWQEAGEAQRGEELLVEQLGLGAHDARDVGRGLARRAAQLSEAEVMKRAVADFIGGACCNLAAHEARAAAEAASAALGVRSVERLQRLWAAAGEGAAGEELLVARLGLGEHDARDLGRELARRAQEEAKEQAELAAEMSKRQAVAEFLLATCGDLCAGQARAAADSAAEGGVRSVRKLKRRWKRTREQSGEDGARTMLMQLLGVDEDDADTIGEGLHDELHSDERF